MIEETSIARDIRENILISLKAIQSKFGYISEADIAEVAKSYETSISDVYGVATFYSFLCVKPAGKNVIRICRSLPCHLKEGEAVRSRLIEILGIGPGETTPDGRFSLEVTNCIGACDIAPAMLINGEPRGNLTQDNIASILNEYR
jgi:NADH:ubiquinone oxidoreductase subunit E